MYIGNSRIDGGGGTITYGVQVKDKFGNIRSYNDLNILTRNSIGITGATNSMIQSVSVGNDVTKIQDGMFAGLTELTSVDMHSC